MMTLLLLNREQLKPTFSLCFPKKKYYQNLKIIICQKSDKTRSTTAVEPQHLEVKEKDIRQNYPPHELEGHSHL